MINKKELIALRKISKKILDRDTLKKLKTSDNIREEYEALKFSIKTNLNKRYDSFKEAVEILNQRGKDTFFVETKLNLLKSKIGLFTSVYHEKDFNNVLNLLKDVEKEIKNV